MFSRNERVSGSSEPKVHPTRGEVRGADHSRRRRHRHAVRDAGRRAHRGRSRFAGGIARRVLWGDRTFGLRQDHAVQCDRRPARRLSGPRHRRRRDDLWSARLDRHDLPGGIDLPLAHRDRQCGVPARDHRHAEEGAAREGAPLRQACRPRRLRAALSGGAVRAACASACRWRARSPPSRRSC